VVAVILARSPWWVVLLAVFAMVLVALAALRMFVIALRMMHPAAERSGSGTPTRSSAPRVSGA